MTKAIRAAVILCAALALTGCGGGGKKKTSSPGTFIVFFQPGTATLTPDSLATLNTAARAAIKRSAPVAVVGHSDTFLSAEQSQALSNERALAVAGRLLGYGIPEERVTYAARGEQLPAVATGDGVREPRNERAEVIVVVNIR
ncbi:OmpA family protein [Sulfitobacter sp. D35]|uniref:OmpA family protein n=1 Tax=Sulfitobacter sp. D35 TaxID=3083252 RepID=UPI00296EB54E|nr:OmpA family protein [Sulfitobacter sp. D35]MDW4499002.1 OmpA family protein [Sulfitobacter sp. D35]